MNARVLFWGAEWITENIVSDVHILTKECKYSYQK